MTKNETRRRRRTTYEFLSPLVNSPRVDQDQETTKNETRLSTPSFKLREVERDQEFKSPKTYKDFNKNLKRTLMGIYGERHNNLKKWERGAV